MTEGGTNEIGCEACIGLLGAFWRDAQTPMVTPVGLVYSFAHKGFVESETRGNRAVTPLFMAREMLPEPS